MDSPEALKIGALAWNKMNSRTVTEINSLSRDEFVRVLGPVFERSPWIAEATWPKRPFATREA